MTAYATRHDLYTYGMPRGMLGMSGQLAESALASTDTITLNGHGFVTGDAIIFRAAEGGVLPAPLAYGPTYYVIYVNDAQFQVSATPTGSAINLTTDGVNVLVAIALPIEAVLEYYSRWVDGFIPANAVPLATPYPIIIVGLVCELASKKLQQIAGVTSVSVAEAEIAAKAQLERFIKGLPIRDVSPQIHTNTAPSATLVVGGMDPRGWGSGILPDGLIPKIFDRPQ